MTGELFLADIGVPGEVYAMLGIESGSIFAKEDVLANRLGIEWRALNQHRTRYTGFLKTWRRWTVGASYKRLPLLIAVYV